VTSQSLDAERPSGAAQVIPAGLDAVLVLLRHGQTQFIVEKRFQGAMEAPLTALGEEQARRAGRRLAAPAADPPLPIPNASPFAIVHSQLGRARRSAQGSWEGLTEQEIAAGFGDSLAQWRRWPERFHAPGGETLADVRRRVETALSSLLTEMAAGTRPGTLDRHQVLGYGDGSADTRRWSLIVGHGGVFRVVACVLLGLQPEHFWNFDFGLGSITVVEIRAGRAVLRAINLDSHLGEDAGQAAAESAGRNAAGAL